MELAVAASAIVRTATRKDAHHRDQAAVCVDLEANAPITDAQAILGGARQPSNVARGLRTGAEAIECFDDALLHLPIQATQIPRARGVNSTRQCGSLTPGQARA